MRIDVPSPLVGEGSSVGRYRLNRVRGLLPQTPAREDRTPHPALTRHLLPQGGKGKRPPATGLINRQIMPSTMAPTKAMARYAVTTLSLPANVMRSLPPCALLWRASRYG